jgi:hypothetical protein
MKFLAGLRENLQRVEEAASCLRFNQEGRSLVLCYLCTEAPILYKALKILKIQAYFFTHVTDYDFNILQF